MKRKKPPNPRPGKTHKIKVGSVSVYVTVNDDETGNPIEMFSKSDGGHTGWCDALSVTASLAMQHGCPLKTLLEKWRGMRFPPDGVRAFSIPDAIARRLLDDENQGDARCYGHTQEAHGGQQAVTTTN